MNLDRAERTALKKLVKMDGSCEHSRLPPARAQRFIQLGLLVDARGGYHLTLRGQIEVLRQRYRRMRPSLRPVTISASTVTLLDTKYLG